tara:strand:- start:1388 stop:1804 length:417 start_codon:yes stop_codon:yes gene_type:complete
MTLPWQAWQDLLRVAKKGPVTLPPAVRGQLYSHIITYPGDVTTATLTGEVRASPDATSALVEFTIGTPSYDSGTGKTTWTFSLAEGSGSGSTGALPADGDADGVQYFPYDFLLALSGGAEERLFGGLLPVSGHITEPA